MKTSYSNGKPRMKFSANEIKQSLPGDVNLVMEDGEMIVEYTRNGLYETVYDYDERSLKPKFNRLNWNEIQKNATQSLNKSLLNLQLKIKLSPLVEANIKTFKEKYGQWNQVLIK